MTGVDAQASSPAAEASIARNTVLAFAAQLATGTFTAVLTLYLLRALGQQVAGPPPPPAPNGGDPQQERLV